MEQQNWQVNYPKGMIKYIDYFRKKYLQYETFDEVLDKYISTHLKSGGRRICSLGSGTGRHEAELAKKGFEVVGLERNKESIEIAEQYIKSQNLDITMFECDFLIQEEVEKTLSNIEPFDIIVLLYIPISTTDYLNSINYIAQFINVGGIFITDFFGYTKVIDTSKILTFSEVEVADSTDKKDFAVRLNYYEYLNDVINWDAIYLYHDENNKLCMGRDHDILEVTPEIPDKDPIFVEKQTFDLLPTYKITELHDYVAPPHLYEYLIGWRKKI